MRRYCCLFHSLALVLIGSLAASAAEERAPQGVPPGVEKPLRIAPRPGNGRNSEGDFIQLKDGRILLVYTKFIGTGDHAPAELVGRYSADGGKTWTNEDVPILARSDEDANLMSVSLLRLADDRIALFYIRKYAAPEGAKYPFLDDILMRTSSDEGESWSKATSIVPRDQPGYRVLNNDRVIQLQSGRLVVPLAVHYVPGWPGYKPSAEIVCYLSDDQGQSWRASQSRLTSDLLAQEPGVVEQNDGDILMFCRSRDCQLISQSDDGGETWSPLKRSNIPQPTASPASIERIPSTGDLLLVWNNGDDPLAKAKPVGRRPLSAAISKDEGESWQHIKNLGTDPNGWYCYTAIEFVDEHVLLGHCEFPGLNSLQITRVPISWFYEPAAQPAATAKPLVNAHAHNDYLHQRPLLDALAHGFTSVEADIFLVDGRLLVAHSRRELQPDRTLKALYLDPLRERVRAGNGSVYPAGGPFYLLIDIKDDAETTYAALAKVLAEYGEMISVVRDGKLESKAVNVIVSGNRPLQTMTDETVRYAGIDGRFADLDSELPSHLMPLISDNWRRHFQWDGTGDIGEADQRKLTTAVDKAHARGRRIRFWATPETEAMWQVLQAAGVDAINTDDLAGLEQFLRTAAAGD